MGASKCIMEDLVMAYSSKFKVTAARFANVAFLTVLCQLVGLTGCRKAAVGRPY